MRNQTQNPIADLTGIDRTLTAVAVVHGNPFTTVRSVRSWQPLMAQWVRSREILTVTTQPVATARVSVPCPVNPAPRTGPKSCEHGPLRAVDIVQATQVPSGIRVTIQLGLSRQRTKLASHANRVFARRASDVKTVDQWARMSRAEKKSFKSFQRAAKRRGLES